MPTCHLSPLPNLDRLHDVVARGSMRFTLHGILCVSANTFSFESLSYEHIEDFVMIYSDMK